MAYIEKVIKALDCRNTYDNDYSCTECPYFSTELGNHHAYCDYHRMMNDAIELLKEQKQIVRCKDCKHWDADEHDCNIKIGWFACGADWFCADGERAET